MKLLFIPLIILLSFLWMSFLLWNPSTIVKEAQAAVFCANGRPAVPFKKMVEYLAKRYKEAPSHLGTSGKEVLVQFGNREKGTMSMVTVTVEGLACLVLAADDWEFNSNPLPSFEPVF